MGGCVTCVNGGGQLVIVIFHSVTLVNNHVFPSQLTQNGFFSDNILISGHQDIESSGPDLTRNSSPLIGCSLKSKLQRRFFEDFLGCCKESIIGWEPVSIVHYTRPKSSIKQPTPS